MRSSKIQHKPITLLEITESDIELVRQWRNRPDIAKFMLTKGVISPEQQQLWYSKISVAIDQQHFLILYQDRKIGVANIKAACGTALEESISLEAGIYIADEKYRNTLMSFLPAIVLNDYCFDGLSCKTLNAIVLPENESAVRFNCALGYEMIDDSPLVKMRLKKMHFKAASEKMRRLFR